MTKFFEAFFFLLVSFIPLSAGMYKYLKASNILQKKPIINKLLHTYKKATNNKYYYLSAISPAFACFVFIIEPHAQDSHEYNDDTYKKLSHLTNKKCA